MKAGFDAGGDKLSMQGGQKYRLPEMMETIPALKGRKEAAWCIYVSKA